MKFASKILIQRKSFSSNSHTSLDKGPSIIKHKEIGCDSHFMFDSLCAGASR